MPLIIISFIAGVLTVLAPCILPLLPLILGSASSDEKSRMPVRTIVIISSLAVSVIFFTFLLKATTFFVNVSDFFWAIISGGILIYLGLTFLMPSLWNENFLSQKMSIYSNKKLSENYIKKTFWANVITGAALGLVFSACSPTYLFVVATVLPASTYLGLMYLSSFVFGLSLTLFLIALLGRRILEPIFQNSDKSENLKKIFGVLILFSGVLILFGLDKKITTFALDSGYLGVVNFDQKLLEGSIGGGNFINQSIQIPRYIQKVFPNTNWSKTSKDIEKIISGGPGKDGIPALTNPKFVNIKNWESDKKTLAILVKEQGIVKVYPYNILNWHEIVNDKIANKNILITFCPLCGTAIAYSPKTTEGFSEFGVSGSLIESNMVMYDRKTESLWQQSTGESIAGNQYGEKLDLVNIQLLTVGEIEKIYPQALIMSTDTGHERDYDRNPYSGYDNEENLVFEASISNKKYHPKTIFVVFNLNEKFGAIEWKKIEDNKNYTFTLDGQVYNVTRRNKELTINNQDESIIPFYFEMWFSFVTQHQNDGEEILLKEK